ncbi:hypothetical protein [Bosea sp. BIWAKO-01]|uniref:c-type cytochrome n=1 Tax=Bosea sp. BIWAKO-01 TaxID=506668 RepID=UPI0008533F64|nr:hypothetical protein [Bosea sp. BIWAKO-01]
MGTGRAIAECASRPALATLAGLAALIHAMSSAQAAGDRALGEYLSSECTACHQTSGRHDGGIPAIVGVPADQFIALMNSYRDKQRENQVMRTIAGRLSQEEVEALASYYGSLKPAP